MSLFSKVINLNNIYSCLKLSIIDLNQKISKTIYEIILFRKRITIPEYEVRYVKSNVILNRNLKCTC